MRLTALALVPLLSGCAVEVWHPTRTLREQQRDIKICHEHGLLTSNYNALHALDEVFVCLEQKGYQRGRPPKKAEGDKGN